MVDATERGIGMDLLRSAFALIDKVIYWLLSLIYEIFFNVATANIISGETIKSFYNRVQLILGIIIMFKLVISLFNGIMNPDSLRNEKTGVSSMIKRVIMVLIMLILLVPLNIPSSDIDDSVNSQKSWNKRMNENGILFGTLYELQSRLLNQNTVARLILGVEDVGFSDSDTDSNSTYKESANELATIVLRCFVTINLNKEDGDPANDDDRMCKEEDLEKYDESYDVYNDQDSTTGEILSQINQMCDNETGLGGERYAYNYSVLFSTVVGVLFVVIIVSFTIDAAIRVFKLAILRLIAPVPILSYIDTKTQSAFQNWVKTVGTTYGMLFVRLAIVDFVIFFIREFDRNGLGLTVAGSGAVAIISKIFVYLGLLMFAKEAPKFIFDTLGIKKTQGLFSGLAGLSGFTSGAINNWKASREATKHKYPEGDPEVNSFRNRAKALVNAIGGGAMSAGSAYHDYVNAGDNKWRTAMDRKNSEQAWRLANASQGGTAFGRMKNRFNENWLGDSEYRKENRKLEGLKRKAEDLNRDKDSLNRNKSIQETLQNSGKNLIKGISDEVQKKGAYFDLNGKSYKDINGIDVGTITGDLKGIKGAITTGESTGIYKYGGYEFDAATLNKMYADALDYATDSYISGTAKFADGHTDLNQSQTLAAQITNVMNSYQQSGYQQISDINTLREDLKSVNDTIGVNMINLGNQIDNLDTQIYDNTVQTKATEQKVKELSVDVRGNDGRPGGK